MDIKSNVSVGEIVRSNFKTAQLFEKNKIDFCCGGGISLSEACAKSNVDINKLIPEIEALVQTSDPDSKYMDSLSLDALSDYIVKRHHSYVNENIPFLRQNLQKLCEVHGDHHPELFEVRKLFGEMADNLIMHMEKEETVLFPYILKMVKFKNEGKGNASEFGPGQNPIDELDEEHKAEGERLVIIDRLTNGYTCPPDGCNTFRVTYQTMKEFELDLHRHIHLESNILFKKAIELEKDIIG